MYGNVNRKKHPDGGHYREYFYYACKHRTFVNGYKCTYRKQWGEDKLYDEIEEIETLIEELETRLYNIRQEKISGDNVYRFLLFFISYTTGLRILRRKPL